MKLVKVKSWIAGIQKSLTNRQSAIEIIPGLILIFLGMALIYIYRRGGIVDSIYDQSSRNGLRDLGIYISASKDVLAGLNPYSQDSLAFRSGTFGVLLFALFPANTFGFILGQVVNLIGFVFFSYSLLGKYLKKEQLLILLAITFLFSCTREVFSTGQITGILAGLIGVGFKFAQSRNFGVQFLAATCFAIALDLKPNLFLFFVIIIYISLNRVREMALVPVVLVIGHAAVDLCSKRLLEKSWISSLMSVNNNLRDPSSTGTRTVWPLIRHIFGIERIPSLIPAILFLLCGAVLVWLTFNSPNFGFLPLSLLIPAFYNYFHLYSLFPGVVLVLWAAFRMKEFQIFGAIFPFLLFSGANYNVSHFIVTLISALVFSLLFVIYELVQPPISSIWKFLSISVSVSLVRLIFTTELEPTYTWEIVQINFVVFSLILTSIRLVKKAVRIKID